MPSIQSRLRIINFKSLKQFTDNTNTSLWFGTKLFFGKIPLRIKQVPLASRVASQDHEVDGDFHQ